MSLAVLPPCVAPVVGYGFTTLVVPAFSIKGGGSETSLDGSKPLGGGVVLNIGLIGLLK